MTDPVRPVRWVGALIALLVSAPIVALLSWPQAFGVQRAMLVSQLIAFRAPLALALGGFALLAALVAVLRRRVGVAAALAVVLAAGAGVNAVVLAGRGTGSDLPGGDLTVLAWNTQMGATTARDVADLVAEVGADIVTLPETEQEAATATARILAEQGIRMTPSTMHTDDDYPWVSTSVLISAELGEYREDHRPGPAPGPSAVWVPVDGQGPTIVAAHTVPPLPDTMGIWRAGLRWIADRCADPEVIVAGDLNATPDHLAGLGSGCTDAAVTAGSGAAGTWPADVPAWLASPIDHVLTGSAWVARGARVIDAPEGGGDHRALVVVLDQR